MGRPHRAEGLNLRREDRSIDPTADFLVGQTHLSQGGLTDGEREVVALVAQGLTNQQIADPNLIFPGQYHDVPQGGTIHVFALK